MFALVINSLAYAANDPLACQPNAEQPMLPIFHLIGNVTKNADGSIKLESINDCSGVTFSGGLYHIFHQCCQNHFDHVISKDLIHWQRLPPPIQPVTLKTWDGSVTMLTKEEGGPLILYDAQDGKQDYESMSWREYTEHVHAPRDKPILGVARLDDVNDDRYLLKWKRDANNPVIFDGAPAAFPGQIFQNEKKGYYNMVMQGNRYRSNDTKFMHWKNEGAMVGHGENGGQWWMHVPNQLNGSPPPSGVSDHIVNIGGGDHYLFGNYDSSKETFTPWSPTPPSPTLPPTSPSIPYSRMMQGANLPGGDFYVGCANNTCKLPPTGCQKACDAHSNCQSWTLVPNEKCCLKHDIPHVILAKNMYSGVKNPNAPTPSPAPAPSASGLEAHLEGGGAGWFGAQMTHDPAGSVKDRMMMIGWATPDYHGPAGPGIGVLTRLTGLREVNFDAKTMNLVANPIPELKNLRTGTIASETGIKLASSGQPHAVAKTSGGAAASADVELTFHNVHDAATFGACVLVNSTNAGGLGITITVTNKTGVRMASVAAGECSAMSEMELEASVTSEGGSAPPFPLFDDESSVTVRITPDRSLADFFVQGGRWSGTVAWRSKTPRKAEDSAVVLFSRSSGINADANVYGMGCGWLFPSYTEHPTI
jgi:sucrose-6-phosphate hydrolase SacC (GH32 family)